MRSRSIVQLAVCPVSDWGTTMSTQGTIASVVPMNITPFPSQFFPRPGALAVALIGDDSFSVVKVTFGSPRQNALTVSTLSRMYIRTLSPAPTTDGVQSGFSGQWFIERITAEDAVKTTPSNTIGSAKRCAVDFGGRIRSARGAPVRPGTWRNTPAATAAAACCALAEESALGLTKPTSPYPSEVFRGSTAFV